MGQIISISGQALPTGAPVAWSSNQRAAGIGGGRVLASVSNTDLVYVLALPTGDEAPTEPLTASTPGAIGIPPGSWVGGTDFDSTNVIYLSAASGEQMYTCSDLRGIVQAGLQGGSVNQLEISGGSNSNSSPVVVSEVYASLVNLNFLGVGAVSAKGYFVDTNGNQVGVSFSGNIAAGGNAAQTLAGLYGQAIPAAATGVWLKLSGNIYWVVTADATDFTANYAHYPQMIAGPDFNAFGKVAA